MLSTVDAMDCLQTFEAEITRNFVDLRVERVDGTTIVEQCRVDALMRTFFRDLRTNLW
jgi:hypothetical protein